MFFRRKSIAEKPDFSRFHTDIHSHLLPGIDDGSPDIQTSLQLVRGMMELGFKKLITTPHIMQDIYPNSKAVILEKSNLLNSELKSLGLEVEVKAAAEYFLDDHVASLLENKEPLLTISGKMVLVEFSMINPSMGLKEILFDMQVQGYVPVIAHPERYVYLERDKNFYDELKATGCLFQLNILSLTGYYGKKVNEFAQYLLKKNYYDLLGSDLHNAHHLKALQHKSLVSVLNKLYESGKIINSQL